MASLPTGSAEAVVEWDDGMAQATAREVAHTIGIGFHFKVSIHFPFGSKITRPIIVSDAANPATSAYVP
jgi:hypothetical protein